MVNFESNLENYIALLKLEKTHVDLLMAQKPLNNENGGVLFKWRGLVTGFVKL